MKILNILTALIVLHLSSSLLIAAGLNSVYSKDGNDIWSVGLNGYVIHSIDGGVSWTNSQIGSTTYNSVTANGQYVWIAGNGGILQLSSDNGFSWNQLTLAGSIDLKSVFFINSTTGWIAGSNGKILRSSNSGFSWITQITPVINNLNCVTFADNLNGVACGASGTVLTTTNGGASWAIAPTTVTQELLSVDIKGAAIIASGIDRTVIISTNSGSSWGKIDYKMQTRVDINSVFMFDQDTYFSCGNDGFIRKSTDRGATFQYQPNPMLADLSKIFFYNSSSGWAAGKDNNVVIRTTDGGNTWHFPPGMNQVFTWGIRFGPTGGTWGNIFSLSSQNPREIYITSLNRVYRSLNFGQSFTQISTAQIPYGNTPHSFIISPIDSNKMLVAYDSNRTGQTGRILRTTNFGGSWSVVFSHEDNVDSNPLAIDPDHPDTVYLASTDSLIFRSSNFGLTWFQTGPTVFKKICTIHVIKGHSNIILCGVQNDTNTAYVYRSTDFGNTWNIVFTSYRIPSEEPPEIPAITSNIAFPDKIFLTVYGGDVNGVHISSDDGLTWTRNFADTNAWGLAISNDDPNLLILGDDDANTTYLSYNGGSEWFSLPYAIYPNNQSFLFFNRKVILAQQHNGILLLTPSYDLPIGILPISNEVPKEFTLYQNYPNPFNPETKIKFEIPAGVTNKGLQPLVQLKIYDAIGREITTLVNEELKAGVYEVNWNAADFPSGIYFYLLQTDDFKESKKMILIK